MNNRFSRIWSDYVYLSSLELRHNVTHRKRRILRIIRKSDRSKRRHRRCIEKQRLFTSFIEILCTKILPQNLSGICILPLSHSLCYRHLYVLSLDSILHLCVPLLCKNFSLSLLFLNEP